jgi:hypothetical protein
MVWVVVMDRIGMAEISNWQPILEGSLAISSTFKAFLPLHNPSKPAVIGAHARPRSAATMFAHSAIPGQ